MKNKVTLSLVVFYFMISGLVSQDMYHVFADRDVMSLSQKSILESETWADLHKRFPADWIKEYITTEVSVITDSHTKVARGNSQYIDNEQKKLLESSSVGDQVEVKVQYIPLNDLSYNPQQELHFVYKVIPYKYSNFPGGDQARIEYIKNTLEASLSDQEREEIDVAKVSFRVDKQGNVVDVLLDESTATNVVNDKILNAFCKMPKWVPASDNDGNPVDHIVRYYTSKNNKTCMINTIVE